MLLCLDIAFRNTGWVLIENSVIYGLGIIKTEKSKKKNIRVSDDNADAAQYVAVELANIIRKASAGGVIGEIPAGGQSAKALSLMYMGIAVVASVCAVLDLPREFCTPGDIKKAVCGSRGAGKDAIKDKMIEYWMFEKQPIPRSKFRVETGWGAFLWNDFEHVADALGSYIALRNQNLVKLFG